jgi:hypothetical protein
MNPSYLKRPDAAGHRRHPAGALALLIVIAAIGVAAADASASGTLPVSPTFLNATTAYNGLQVEPATITYTGDGTGFLGGANARNQNSGIHWTKWTTKVALGTGFNQLNNCNPSCAGGTFRGYRVKIELWRPRRLAGTLVFTRMTIFYEKRPPRGEPRHYTFTDTHTGGTLGGYGWGPPGPQGYCIHTYGQKPFATCKNIHSLP